MIAEIGQFSLILALVISVVQAVVPHIGIARRASNLVAVAHTAAVLQFICLALASVLLAYAFVVSDYSLMVVASNSNAAMPTHFRLSASWGNHEGSLLLWVLILALFGVLLVLFGQSMPAVFKARVLAIQGLLGVCFLGLTVFTSNPFLRLDPPAMNGMELNPLLQDIGLVLHPPFLYIGYVGFSTVFSFAVAALIEGRAGATWARQVRPWVLIAWVFLTIGITLGSYWAYYELGWGGWWFWDPVENASFMPWLVGTALLHSVIVVERRETLVLWTLLLSILTFSLSLVGTFLVRSGIITSVHAFATDPARGIWILLTLFFLCGGALAVFAMRASTFRENTPFTPISREGALILNNILLIVAMATVFLGTFFPLIAELLADERISVGPPYFNASFVPLMMLLMLALSLGPVLRWKRDKLWSAFGRLKWAVGAMVLTVILTVALAGFDALGAALAFGVVVWLIGGAFKVWADRVRLFSAKPKRVFELIRRTPRATYGMILAHAGLGLMVAGITAVTNWDEEEIVAIRIGENVSVGGYVLTLTEVTVTAQENYQVQRASLDVTRGGAPATTLLAERRYYPNSDNTTTEAAISARFLSLLYASLGGPGRGDTWVIRVYFHPFIVLIWLGPLMMAMGGVLSLADRRLRVGAPQARTATPPPVTA